MTLRVIDLGMGDAVKQKVLVVDDEHNVQSIVFDSLSEHYQLFTAYNGRDGANKALHIKPDLIIMDIVMPDMGGYEAVRLLQQNPETKNIPVIIFTAQDLNTSTIDMIRMEPNVVGFVTKPFRPKGLRETVRIAIQKKLGDS